MVDVLYRKTIFQTFQLQLLTEMLISLDIADGLCRSETTSAGNPVEHSGIKIIFECIAMIHISIDDVKDKADIE